MITYPRALEAGDLIGVTAPSSGVRPTHHARLDLALGHLRDRGFKPVEGNCLRRSVKHVSAPKEERAAEFMKFWADPKIRAIFPPWGGELLVEILPLLDFERLRRDEPKWVIGYSDISTLLFALTLQTGIATMHGTNLFELVPAQSDPLTTGLLPTLARHTGETFVQHASEQWQETYVDSTVQPAAAFNLTEPTAWKVLNESTSSASFRGRMIGGCVDTIARLVGTPYGDLPGFVRDHRRDGVVFFFENCELRPCELARTLWNLRLAGWFEGLAGILIGRSGGPEPKNSSDLSQLEAVRSVLGDFEIPIVYDADIGHRPPNLSIVNGAVGTVVCEDGRGSLTQSLV